MKDKKPINKKLIAVVMSIVTVLALSISTFATDEGGGTSSSGLSTFISTITSALSDFSTTTMGTIIVAGLGISVGLIIAWFAFRWIYGRVKRAMKGRG